MGCPLAAADSVSIGFHTQLSASLPPAVATSDIHLAANDQDGESVLCVDLHLAKQEEIEVAADSLSLSFKDCGAKHAVTKDVQPTTLALGADTAITGTGSLDKAVSGGTYDMELKAGGGLIDSHFTGNNCEAKSFDLPLGLGKLSWDGISCPLAAADSVSIGFHTQLASSLPPSLATSDIHLGANDQDGESVLCVDLHLAKEEELEVAADSLSLSFKDCGAKHAVTKDVQPTTLALGADTAITGTGCLDKAVSGGTYDMELKAGG